MKSKSVTNENDSEWRQNYVKLNNFILIAIHYRVNIRERRQE